jgi:methionyl-tRNA formyltransferase
MKTFILLTDKPWHDDLYLSLKNEGTHQWIRIKDKGEFTFDKLQELKPEKIFIPHWSYIIPQNIFTQFECILFHMTDLPYGRGGSPLQNLIVAGHEKTVISAIRVVDKIDAGDIYLKEPLSLLGTAEEIFIRSSRIINLMIDKIIKEAPAVVEQTGDVVIFKRRTPGDGDISKLNSIEAIYDYIRMLDCDGYPNAFLEINGFRLEFTRATLKGNHSIIADVKITKK